MDAEGTAGKAVVAKKTAGFQLHDYAMTNIKFVALSADWGLIAYRNTESGNSHGKEFAGGGQCFRTVGEARRPMGVRIQPGDSGEIG